MVTEGFYRFVYGGSAGSGIGLVALQGGNITGIDGGGGQYDGSYSAADDGVTIRLDVTVPANMPLVTGERARAEPWILNINAKLPSNFGNGMPFNVRTPYGPINVSFALLRRL